MKKLCLLFTSVACMALASCTKAPQEFIITWKNYDDTVLAKDTVKAGTKPVYKGETPKRESTAEQTFTFTGWTPKVVEAKEDATYVATYKEEARKYAITFLAGEYGGKKGKFSDGKDSKVYYIPYGTVPSNIEIPTVEPTATEEYPFKDWGGALEKVTGEKTYTATYTKDDRHFNIVFDANGGYFDGDKTKTKVTHRIKYNDTYKDDIQGNPSRDDTAQYKYTFSKWDPELPTTDTIPTEDVTYTAQWGSELQEYEITFDAGEGHFGTNPEEHTCKKTLKYGAFPKQDMPIPKDSSDPNKANIFTGWNPEISEVTGPQTYTAKYEEVDLQILTLSFKPTDSPTIFKFTYDGILTSVDWGDETTDQSCEHTYNEAGEYTIVVKGIFSSLLFYNIDHLTEAIYTGAWETIKNFNLCKDLKTVTLDSPTIKKISGYAFDKCTGLETITLKGSKDSVNEVERNAFDQCNKLFTNEDGIRYVKINDNPYYLADTITSSDNCMLHEGCVIIANNFSLSHEHAAFILLVKSKMPTTLKWIGESAFSGISETDQLKLQFENGLKGIHNYAFSYLGGLVSISIPDSIEYIGESVFSGCYNLQYNTINKNEYLGNLSNKYLILTRHEADKFQCESSCTIIAPGAFEYQKSKITVLNIPKNIKYVGTYLFTTNYLKNITVDIDNQYYYSPDKSNAIIEKASQTLMLGCYSTSMIDGIKHIARGAFCGCDNLTKANIPDTVQTIDRNSFENCSNLTEIRIPRLTMSLYSYSFYLCREIQTISVSPYNPMYNSNNNCNAIISNKSDELLLGTQNTIIPNGVTSIGYQAFSSTHIKQINIPESVLTIGSYAFYYCTELTEVMLPKTLKAINSNAFSDCYALKSVVIPKSVEEMQGNIFGGNIVDKKPTIFVYCEAESKPTKWSDDWEVIDAYNSITLTSANAIEWGYKPSNII